ncbi:hypothetical protein ABW21_db0206779 [Orbilia brochopaga]|nr:hypothetical protein ABW21_db0206779 [Drechslerella brochopaga]
MARQFTNQNVFHADYCQKHMLRPPVWEIVSDRRGGRTAWSATVVIGGDKVSARYWYDGNYLANAKEDAAEDMNGSSGS